MVIDRKGRGFHWTETSDIDVFEKWSYLNG